MSKATEGLLSELHGALADAMQAKLKSQDVTASDLNVIRQFLKDNGINTDGDKDDKIKNISDDLPDLDDSNVTPLYG
ncbi:hypothetical protein ACQU0X_08540 [Pseudovibrio ascidiaceicola]|uniref:hypothetical protein n=1 Tax=Pseudovibrio ascidiaceicola TaxID=285279 RepID=UPI003D362CE7